VRHRCPSLFSAILENFFSEFVSSPELHGIGSTGVISLPHLDSSNAFRLVGETPNDCTGCSVSAAGDVNGDGLDDLLIGAPGHNTYTGRTYIVLGQRSTSESSSSGHFIIALVSGIAGGLLAAGLLLGCYFKYRKNRYDGQASEPLMAASTPMINSENPKSSTAVSSENLPSAKVLSDSMAQVFSSGQQQPMFISQSTQINP
jgi:FG-GAP repeat protein